MFPGGSTIIIPYKEDSIKNSDKVYNEYFVELIGSMNENQIQSSNGKIYYNGSGNHIGKIGVDAKHAKPYLGSFNGRKEYFDHR